MPDFKGTMTSAEGRAVIHVGGRVETPPGRIEEIRGTLRLALWQVGVFSDADCRLDIDGGPSLMIRLVPATSPPGPGTGHEDVAFVYAGPA